ncbi:hypothetical protein L7F22_041768 [Adiantum nelumboides]|nr:hypothetical protein [Adiantum nelumboides]
MAMDMMGVDKGEGEAKGLKLVAELKHGIGVALSRLRALSAVSTFTFFDSRGVERYTRCFKRLLQLCGGTVAISMDEEIIRFGILGCAYIARKMSRAIMQTEGVCLYAIGSRSLAKAQAFAKDNGFQSDTKIYGSYQSVLDDEAVDVVYIPLPTSLHVEWVLKASAKKKTCFA